MSEKKIAVALRCPECEEQITTLMYPETFERFQCLSPEETVKYLDHSNRHVCKHKLKEVSKFTRKDFYDACVQMWNWLYLYPELEKSDWPGQYRYTIKGSIKSFTTQFTKNSGCFGCMCVYLMYGGSHVREYDCKHYCIMKWQIPEEMALEEDKEPPFCCTEDYTAFDLWDNANYYIDYALAEFKLSRKEKKVHRKEIIERLRRKTALEISRLPFVEHAIDPLYQETIPPVIRNSY